MEEYDKDRDKVIERSMAQGLSYMLTVGTQESYFKRVIEIVEKHDSIYGAIGIHPHNSKNYSQSTVKAIEQCLAHPKIVAFGEIGLDFFKNYSPRNTQMRVFRDQLILAKRLGMPAIVHSRNAQEETLDILEEAYSGGLPGVIHCYSYDQNVARKLLNMGFYISIPGPITYGRAETLIDVVKKAPMDRLLAETDAPFLTPVPHRGKRNEPHYVKLTIEKIAQIRGMDIEQVASALQDNFLRVFPKILVGAAS